MIHEATLREGRKLLRLIKRRGELLSRACTPAALDHWTPRERAALFLLYTAQGVLTDNNLRDEDIHKLQMDIAAWMLDTEEKAKSEEN